LYLNFGLAIVAVMGLWPKENFKGVETCAWIDYNVMFPLLQIAISKSLLLYCFMYNKLYHLFDRNALIFNRFIITTIQILLTFKLSGLGCQL